MELRFSRETWEHFDASSSPGIDEDDELREAMAVAFSGARKAECSVNEYGIVDGLRRLTTDNRDISST